MSSSFIEISRAQSVLDVLEEDFRFALGRFAEGDDVDFMFGLGMYDGNRNPSKQAKGDQALFTVGESVVPEGVRRPFEDLSGADEVEAVVFQVRPSLRLAPGEPHGNNVHTICRCGKSRSGLKRSAEETGSTDIAASPPSHSLPPLPQQARAHAAGPSGQLLAANLSRGDTGRARCPEFGGDRVMPLYTSRRSASACPGLDPGEWRNPEHRDVVVGVPSWLLDSGNPCRNDGRVLTCV
jgi:hypothetical protein